MPGCSVVPIRSNTCRSRYRAVWISDVHLGTRGSKASHLLEFLKSTDCDKLYLVGDFIDIWAMRRARRWPQAHNDVVQKILRKARKGCPVIYIPGNHDELCAEYFGEYGNITIAEKCVHTAADGRRLLVLHGHEFDCVTMNAKWLAVLGDIGYSFLLQANNWLGYVRRVLRRPHWSLSAYVKARVKNAVSYISSFESAVARFATMHGADGVVCGHIHTPCIRRFGEIEYFNTGDWVESCTALVEHDDGRIELIYWLDSATGEECGASAELMAG